MRRRNREAADNPNIAAVYHAAAIGKLLQNAGRNFDSDGRQRQERVVNQATVNATHHAFSLLRGEQDRAHNHDVEIAWPRRL